MSASAKVITQVRKWYVDEVLYQVNKTYLGAAEMINEQIDNNFNDSADDVRDAKNNFFPPVGTIEFPITHMN